MLLNQSNSDEWGERCERQMDNPIVEIAVIENPEDLTEN